MSTAGDNLSKNAEGVRLLLAAKYEEAIAAFSEAIDLDPEYISAYRNRAEAYGKLKRDREAEADNEKVRSFGEVNLQAGKRRTENSGSSPTKRTSD